jgi:hypothetical protein
VRLVGVLSRFIYLVWSYSDRKLQVPETLNLSFPTFSWDTQPVIYITIQNILLRVVLNCQLLMSCSLLWSTLILYSPEFGMLTASCNTKYSACNLFYLQAMTDSDNNHFFLPTFHRLAVPIAIPRAHSDNQNFQLLMKIPCSDWKLRPFNGPGK